mmetsp:Transcript_51712/g.121322  ORF Transcript_51712/g.121322 Transcript_51712/m.121322 type:complete len:154 (+) Transcript_51712:360-821(+)
MLSDSLGVYDVVNGTSAWECGRIEKGDQLIGINGNPVSGNKLAHVKPLIVGRIGSTVTLSFRRKYGARSEYTITLIRGAERIGKPTPDKLGTPSGGGSSNQSASGTPVYTYPPIAPGRPGWHSAPVSRPSSVGTSSPLYRSIDTGGDKEMYFA